MSSEKYYKEQIRNRMMSFATAFWDVQKAENFDPVVKLLLEALANEMYLLGEDFNHIESRLLDKTARILTPGIMLAPTPAHGIAHATPFENDYVFRKDTGIYYDVGHSVSDDQLGAVYFYPSCNTPLYKGDVRLLLYDDLIYKVDAALNKTMIARLDQHTSPETVWVGLDLDDNISNLRNMSFYMELPNVVDSYKYLYLLSCSEWYIGDRKISMRRGIYNIEGENDNEVMSFFENYELTHAVDRNILNLYKNNYLTVNEDISFSASSFLPSGFSEEIPEALAMMLDKKLFWIKIVFPGVFAGKMLEDIRIGINMIPVENKLLRQSTFILDDTFGVIPLKTAVSEYLLDIHSVRNGKGEPYHELLYGKSGQGKADNTYSVRRGGCERFDSRSAKDQLEYLYDMLNDEIHAFSTRQNIKLRSHIQQIVQTLSKLKEVLHDMHETGEVPCYLFIDKMKENERITVDYWVTNADMANNLPAGVPLSAPKSAFLEASTLFLVTSTYGGRKEPKEQERINLYKYELTSRNRILTNNDISCFCKKELGELLTSVSIKNGVCIHQSSNGGLVRTKDVYLHLASPLQDIHIEERLKRDLQIKLEESSPDTFNFRIFIEK